MLPAVQCCMREVQLWDAVRLLNASFTECLQWAGTVISITQSTRLRLEGTTLITPVFTLGKACSGSASFPSSPFGLWVEPRK